MAGVKNIQSRVTGNARGENMRTLITAERIFSEMLFAMTDFMRMNVFMVYGMTVSNSNLEF
jgi:hypothetical protein